jgi:tetratricopeptide (TPR) repeat protein
MKRLRDRPYDVARISAAADRPAGSRTETKATVSEALMLTRVYLVGDAAALALDAVAAEFPTVQLHAAGAPPDGVACVRAAQLFADGARAWAAARALDDARELALDADEAVAALTRLQCLVDRRNAASATEAFDEVLARHRALFARLDKPLVRADYDHARDTWQWMLRLDPDASVAAQLAALFHDVERLQGEADARRQRRATDDQRLREAHAVAGAIALLRALDGIALSDAVVERAAELVAQHERPGPDRERALVNDADALSFFSLNVGGYLDYFGAEQTRKKIGWTLCRMSANARARLGAVRMRPDVRALGLPIATA